MSKAFDRSRKTENEFYFRRFRCEFGQLIQAQQVRLSDIFEIRTDCHSKAHVMRNIPKAGHMPLSRTLSRLMTAKNRAIMSKLWNVTFLNKGITLAILNLLGKMPLQRDWLINMLNGVDTI